MLNLAIGLLAVISFIGLSSLIGYIVCALLGEYDEDFSVYLGVGIGVGIVIQLFLMICWELGFVIMKGI